MAQQYDVIVIGAGNGGLAAAAVTAQKGLKVLLLERHNIPGGSATSFRRGRFEFEASLHELGGYGPAGNPGSVRKLFERLNLDLPMYPIEDCFRAIVTGPDGYDVRMPAGREEFTAAMERAVPGSAPSVQKFFSLADDALRGLAYLGQSRGNPDPAVLQTEHINFMKFSNQPLDTVLNAIGMPKKAQDILATYWGYICISTSSGFSTRGTGTSS